MKDRYISDGGVNEPEAPRVRVRDSFSVSRALLWLNKIVRLVRHHTISIRSADQISVAQIPPSGKVSITPFQRMADA